jgi:hypothetical protein
MQWKNRARLIWMAAIILAILGGILFSLLLLIPYEFQKSWIDGLAADGEVESYTLRVHSYLKYFAGLAAVLFLAAASALIGSRGRSASILEALKSSLATTLRMVGREIKELAILFIPSKEDYVPLIFLGGLMALGIFFRYAYLWRPMGHDEAYTFVAFASRGLRYSISNYHLPNNHVFHTIFVNLAYQLFGDSPAVIRLPAFLAGILIILATFLVGKQFFSTYTALVSASIIASLPVMIDYSTTARGYTILTFFTLLIVSLAAYVKDHKNSVGWGLLIIFSSLGLYTNPTMIYPIGMVAIWLLISKIIKDVSKDYGREYYLYLVTSCVLILITAGILYSPILISSGIQPLFNNDVIQALSWSDFYQSIPVRIKNTWAEWNREIPGWISIVALFGLGASFIIPSPKQKQRITLFLAAFLWIGAALIVQRVAPWPRIWLFLLPLIVVWVSGGVLGLVGLFSARIHRRKYLVIGGTNLLILLSLWVGFTKSFTQFTQKLHTQGEVEEVAMFLADYLQPEDVVAVTSPDRIVLQYYLDRYTVSEGKYEFLLSKPFNRAIVVVNKGFGQTIEYVIGWRSYFDGFDLGPAEEVYRSDRFTIYQLPNG